jgi:hypothetical protein
MKANVNVLQNRRINNNSTVETNIHPKTNDHMWGQLDQLWQLQSHAQHQEKDNDMKNMTNR